MPNLETRSHAFAPAARLYSIVRRDGVLALLLFVAALVLYLPTLSPSVVAADGGELQMLAAVLGVPHPTGYPLLMLLGSLFVHLPLGGDPAFRVTLLGAVGLAVTVGILFLLVRELGLGRLPAVAAALLVASTSRLWGHAVSAEVYTLSSFFIVLSLWLLLRWGAGKTPLWVATLAMGFGLTHHITMRLLGPAVAVYILAVEPKLVLRPRRWLLALACLLLPLALYAYVPLRAAHFDSLPEFSGEVLGVRKTVVSGLVSPHYYVAGSLGLILASDYSQTFFANRDLGLRQLGQYVDIVASQFPLAAIPIILFGIGVLIRRRGRDSVLLLLSYLVLTLAALKYLAVVGEDGHHFAPTYWLAGIWFAAGADAVLAWASTHFGQRMTAGRQTWVRTALLIGLFALPAANIAAHLPQVVAQRQVNVDRGLLSQPLPQGAVLAGEWSLITPLRYRQRVEGVRPDLWVIHADAAGIRTLMGRALAEGKPFYAVRSTAAGPRLLPLPLRDEAAITHPVDKRLGDAVRWRGHDLEPASPRPGQLLLVTLYWQTLGALDRDWTTFIHVLGEGEKRVAQIDRAPVGDFYPPSVWQPGLLLADQYEIKLPPDLPPGRYRIIFGWYSGAERLTWGDGRDAQPLAEITVE